MHPKPLNPLCHTLSVIDGVQMLSGTQAATSGGGWIRLFAVCSAVVTYFSLRLLQPEERQERERLGPDNEMFQLDVLFANPRPLSYCCNCCQDFQYNAPCMHIFNKKL